MDIQLLLTYLSLLDIVNIFLLITSFIFLLSIQKKIPLIRILILFNILVLFQTLLSFIASSSNLEYIKYLYFVKIFNITSIFILLIYFIFYNSNKKSTLRAISVTFILFVMYIATILDYIYKAGKIDYNFYMNTYFPTINSSIPAFLFLCNAVFLYLILKKTYMMIKNSDEKLFSKKIFFEKLIRDENIPIFLFEVVFFILFVILLCSRNLHYIYSIFETFITSFLIFSLILSFFTIFYKKSPILIFKIIYLSLFFISSVIFIYSFILSNYVNNKYVDYERLKIEAVMLQISKGTDNYPKDISYLVDIEKNSILYSEIGYHILDGEVVSTMHTDGDSLQKKYKYQYRILGSDLKDYYIENIVDVYDKKYIIGLPYILYRTYISELYEPILITIISILFFLGIIYQFFLKYILLKPIYYLLGIQNRVNDGDYDVVIEPKGHDEISDISNTFNQIIKHVRDSKNQLEDSYSEIKKYNDILERMVENNNLELKKAYEYLLSRKITREKELSVAKQLQRQLLSIQNIDSINMSIIYNPTDIIGGDIYDISEIKKGHIRVFLADATGHGIQAALFATLLKTEYNNIKYKAKTNEVFEIFNRLFYTTYKNITTFFTSIVIDIFSDEKIIQYSSAGHPSQYAIIDGQILEIKVTQMMTSVMSEEYQSKYETLKYDNSYKIILFTDGLFELENKISNELYKSETLKTIISKNMDKKVNEILDSLINDTSNFIGTKKRNDDITLIGIENKDGR